jgi:preprotein translocase subunit SecF
MQLFPTDKVFNFMGNRGLFAYVSLFMVIGSVILLFYPGPNLGTDFRGGTEVEVAFNPPIAPLDIRRAVTEAGFHSPDVIKVQSRNDAQYLVRVEDVSEISEDAENKIAQAVCFGEALGAEQCPAAEEASEMKVSPGGDKVTVRFREPVDEAQLSRLRKRFTEMVTPTTQIELRAGENNPTIQSARDNKVEIQLMSKGDQLMKALRDALGEDKVPHQLADGALNPLRVEWIGPKAGRQLRDSALSSIAIALVFIMAYIAFRFDLRFAPGAVLALAHDALVTIGVLIIIQKELTLSTVAAILTIVGYSVNDTVVVYDRVRENLGKMRGASFNTIINTSLSEMLARTILTSGTTILGLAAFFVWGTGTLKDFSLTLIIGMVLGTYSSIYVALPLTWWLDRTLFSRVTKQKREIARARKREANA